MEPASTRTNTATADKPVKLDPRWKQFCWIIQTELASFLLPLQTTPSIAVAEAPSTFKSTVPAALELTDTTNPPTFRFHRFWGHFRSKRNLTGHQRLVSQLCRKSQQRPETDVLVRLPLLENLGGISRRLLKRHQKLLPASAGHGTSGDRLFEQIVDRRKWGAFDELEKLSEGQNRA